MTRSYKKSPGHFYSTKPTDNSNTVSYVGPARNFFLQMCLPKTDFVYRSREVHPYTVVEPNAYLDHLDSDLKPGNVGVKKMQQHLEYIFCNLSDQGVQWVIQKLFGEVTDECKEVILEGLHKNRTITDTLHTILYTLDEYLDEDGSPDIVKIEAAGLTLEEFNESLSICLTRINNTLEFNRTVSKLWGLENVEEYYEDPLLLMSEINELTQHLAEKKTFHEQVQLYRHAKTQLKSWQERGMIEMTPEPAPQYPSIEERYYD